MKRRHARTPVSVDAYLDPSGRGADSEVTDISFGGCYVESVTNFVPGESVTFDLTDPNGGTVGFTGVIAHVTEGHGFGLRFTNLGPDQLSFLKRSLPTEA